MKADDFSQNQIEAFVHAVVDCALFALQTKWYVPILIVSELYVCTCSGKTFERDADFFQRISTGSLGALFEAYLSPSSSMIHHRFQNSELFVDAVGKAVVSLSSSPNGRGAFYLFSTVNMELL
jgi:hypothetical protein